jgi:hypothetical protein
MSNPFGKTPPMNYSIIIEDDQDIDLQLIATFGAARIVQWGEGKFRIEGGTTDDRKKAREWAARFLDVRLA